ncbi:MAG: undecaprenyl-diphosphate phosphatase [Lachnospiraceae bacterium]|jgi:undecaprenyl-diphosphatase|nr:undecaprenyl-diphosphate phosphatase [Lachnospiraceae bacterium]MCI9601114.1 undecaprenyl-diphosphate phosphatase [Lachnospiraceae bacterium]
MSEFLKVFLLGIVEGITEWLPISSTGHMILVEEFIQLNVSADFMEMFRVVIQLGAILAVVLLYFPKLWPFCSPKDGWIRKDTWTLWFKVLAAVLPAAVIGIPFDDTLDALFYNYRTVAVTLIVYGVLFIVVENYNRKKRPKVASLDNITWSLAIGIGIFQVLSLIPGTSRSGATILGAILLGASRSVAAEFSFFLGIPVMFGASLLKLVKFGFAFSGAEIVLLLTGMAVAFLVSILAIKFLMNYIKRNDFKPFGYYRIILGVLVLFYFIFMK